MFAMDGSFCKCVLILDFTSQLYHPHSRPRPRLAYTTAPGLKFVIHFLRWHFILHTRHHHPAAAVPRPKYYVRHLFLFNALTATLCHTYRYDLPITLLGSRIQLHMALHCTATATTSQTLDQYVCMHGCISITMRHSVPCHCPGNDGLASNLMDDLMWLHFRMHFSFITIHNSR